MSSHDNVFRGSRSVADYFDPDQNPPLPLIELPDRLNPFKGDNVRIYAKMLTCLPAQNIKSLPALKMLRNEPKARDKKIVEASSGSTVLSLGIIARVLWGNEDVDAYVTNKKSPESLSLLRFFGIRPCLYGGLAQQEPTDPTGIMCRLRKKASQDGDVVYPGQYDNPNNWKAHEEWTGPQIFKQLPEINIFCATVGTGGAITGTGVHLKSQKPSVRVVGVFNVFGDPTPGPRHFHGFHTSGFPWQGTVDSRVEVASVDSYRMSMRLSREGLIAGPSSGQALQGLLEYITQLKQAGGLTELRDEKTGEISCVFPCSDFPYQYLPTYFQKLGTDEFPPIENEILLQCDQAKHDERWIVDAQSTAVILFGTVRTESGDQTAAPSLESVIGSQKDPPVYRVTHKRRNPICSWIPRLLSLFIPSLGQGEPSCCPSHLPAQKFSLTLVLDLRSTTAFKARHLPGSFLMALDGLRPELAKGDLFGDANAVHLIWTQIQSTFDRQPASRLLKLAHENRQAVALVCYNGDASRLGVSTLRSRGIEAFSVEGGFQQLWTVLEKLNLV
ncbi:hypothetical protein QQX98_006346 [Neonectria punicea]|uniref:Rhodanese domain-containing protein n=1 Tax=Neonectria punicea TaxID=979145 RepID=A0ABR1H1D0_9HYPO